jgi:type I restriction enzyme M protein
MREPAKGGSRVAIVHNGSPLFTGAAGSGESEIRRYLLENDLLEAIVALPEQLFYNTGIASYVWLLSNRKAPERRNKVQLIDARELWVRMRRSLGEKRRAISEEQIDEITSLHGAFAEGDRVKIVDASSFGYRTIVVEQPLRARREVGTDTWIGVEDERAVTKIASEPDRAAVVQALATLPAVTFDDEAAARSAISVALAPALTRVPAPLLKTLVTRCLVRDPEAAAVVDAKGRPVPDPDRRDTENIPLDEDVETYLEREVHPFVPGAWCPDPNGKIGYEIPFTRLFYRYTPPRPSAEIKAELKELEGEIHRLLAEVLE